MVGGSITRNVTHRSESRGGGGFIWYGDIIKHVEAISKPTLKQDLFGILRFNIASITMEFKKDIVITCKLRHANYIFGKIRYM